MVSLTITRWPLHVITHVDGDLDLHHQRGRHPLGQDRLKRCQRIFGPDHPTTLWAAACLTGALEQLGQAEPARTLGQDTLKRCQRIFGPDHPIVLYLTQVASVPRVESRGGRRLQ